MLEYMERVSSDYPENIILDACRSLHMDLFDALVIEVFRSLEERRVDIETE